MTKNRPSRKARKRRRAIARYAAAAVELHQRRTAALPAARRAAARIERARRDNRIKQRRLQAELRRLSEARARS